MKENACKTNSLFIQKIKKWTLVLKLSFFGYYVLSGFAWAGIPTWTIEPLAGTKTTQVLAKNSSAVVQYLVSNQSKKAHQLAILPIAGVKQQSTCYLESKGQANSSCLLTLVISTATMPAQGIHEGPQLCQTNVNGLPNRNQCYQPTKKNYLNITVGTQPRRAYITLISTNNVAYCDVNDAGNFSNCSTSGNDLEFPLGIAINSQKTFAYVAQANGVSKCRLAANGALTNCTPTANNISAASAIVLTTDSRVAFVATENIIFKCQIDTTQDLTLCTQTGDVPVGEHLGLAINPAGTFAYITNSTTSEITQCGIAVGSNELINCTNFVGASNPYGIAINPNNPIAYLATPNEALTCPINVNGTLASCSPFFTNLVTAYGIAIDSQGQFTYIVDGAASQVIKCTNTPNGEIGSCITLPNEFLGGIGIFLT